MIVVLLNILLIKNAALVSIRHFFIKPLKSYQPQTLELGVYKLF